MISALKNKAQRMESVTGTLGGRPLWGDVIRTDTWVSESLYMICKISNQVWLYKVCFLKLFIMEISSTYKINRIN